ncbi:SDR family oxidoreductase [Dactylosporangium sp. NPDC050688]|uniref:SDR family oxidoreductase n=1 Tax=Dactylosporangium sp. NPDC050688 TaxID=3157217 RepID=UPI003403B508
MDLKQAVVLVTGGNRGIGKALAAEAVARGARKVYAAARDPRTVTAPDVHAVALDVTDPESARRAAEQTGDVTVLINNAGIYVGASLLTGDLDEVRREFETNFYGPIQVTRAFVPQLLANGGGRIVNVHSALSWVALGRSYSTTKAALWSASDALRLELAPQGIGVTGLHVGYVDTDMTAAVTAPKISPEAVAAQLFDAVEQDRDEVLADDASRGAKRSLTADPAQRYAAVAG